MVTISQPSALHYPIFRRAPLFNHPRTTRAQQTWQWRIKRLVDIVGAGTGLILLSPLLLMVMLLVKLDSPGPCFIRQRRVGYRGQEFWMYKFRSMVVNADEMLAKLRAQNETNELMFKMKRDPRVTRVGRWLRKFSIDELPQLWNVLRGEMSLVGPRPPLPDEVKRYKKGYMRRFGTVPGLTCLWQVSGRSDIRDFRRVVAMDACYIRNWSLMLDLQILLRTIPVVILAKGAA